MCGRMSFQFIFRPHKFFMANSILFIYDYTTIDSLSPRERFAITLFGDFIRHQWMLSLNMFSEL